jgi:hypothetical protein
LAIAVRDSSFEVRITVEQGEEEETVSDVRLGNCITQSAK